MLEGKRDCQAPKSMIPGFPPQRHISEHSSEDLLRRLVSQATPKLRPKAATTETEILKTARKHLAASTERSGGRL